jgi:hypothetical protein
MAPVVIAEALGLSTRGCAHLAEEPAPLDVLAAARVRIGLDLAMVERGVAMPRERAVVKGRR